MSCRGPGWLHVNHQLAIHMHQCSAKPIFPGLCCCCWTVAAEPDWLSRQIVHSAVVFQGQFSLGLCMWDIVSWQQPSLLLFLTVWHCTCVICIPSMLLNCFTGQSIAATCGPTIDGVTQHERSVLHRNASPGCCSMRWPDQTGGHALKVDPWSTV